MWLALTDLFKARWTDMIHDEWIRNVESGRGIPRAKLEEVRDLMDTNVLDAKISGFEYLIDELKLPDPNDRHVLAAAIHSKSDAIVTFNLKDFPEEYLKIFDVELIHPDDFIVYQFDFDRSAVLKSFKAQRANLLKPKMDTREFIDCLYKQQLPQTASILEEYGEFI